MITLYPHLKYVFLRQFLEPEILILLQSQVTRYPLPEHCLTHAAPHPTGVTTQLMPILGHLPHYLVIMDYANVAIGIVDAAVTNDPFQSQETDK